MSIIEEIKPKEEVKLYDRGWFQSEYPNCFVDLKKTVPRPEVLISIGTHEYKGKTYPTEVMTAGEFSVITAPSKSKKSFFKSQLCASYIGGKSNHYFSDMIGHRKEDFIVIDCDTEQSKYYASKSFNRVERIVGSTYDNYLPFKMRHLDAEQRVAFIDYLLEEKGEKTKIVFIDGVADLIEDTNDLVMSNFIAGKLLKWTDTYNIHVCVIIHNAYGTKKPTGHLGSAVVKKAESVFQLEPEESGEIVKVTHQYSRGFPFEPFYFKIKEGEALIYECDSLGSIINSGVKDFKREKPIPTATPNDAFEGNNEVPF